jgi:proteasome lid subunit RPN8/RPN11
MTVAIPETIMVKIRQHAEAHYPQEGAGLILGKVEGEIRVAAEIIPVDNDFAEQARGFRYSIDPLDMLAAEDEADRLGLEIIGVFHSHPDHPAKASEFDRHMAVPWYSYLITSVIRGAAEQSAVWRLDEESEQMVREQLQVFAPETGKEEK